MGWFLRVMDIPPMARGPVGVREWPRRGVLVEQYAKVVQAVDVLLNEWSYLPGQKGQPADEEDGQAEAEF